MQSAQGDPAGIGCRGGTVGRVGQVFLGGRCQTATWRNKAGTPEMHSLPRGWCGVWCVYVSVMSVVSNLAFDLSIFAYILLLWLGT